MDNSTSLSRLTLETSYSGYSSYTPHSPSYTPHSPSVRYGSGALSVNLNMKATSESPTGTASGTRGRNKTAKNLHATANPPTPHISPAPSPSHFGIPTSTTHQDHEEVSPTSTLTRRPAAPRLSIDQVVTRLKPLLDGAAGLGEREISIDGVSSDVVLMLQAKSRKSELPGWENLRYMTPA